MESSMVKFVCVGALVLLGSCQPECERDNECFDESSIAQCVSGVCEIKAPTALRDCESTADCLDRSVCIDSSCQYIADCQQLRIPAAPALLECVETVAATVSLNLTDTCQHTLLGQGKELNFEIGKVDKSETSAATISNTSTQPCDDIIVDAVKGVVHFSNCTLENEVCSRIILATRPGVTPCNETVGCDEGETCLAGVCE